MTLSPAPKRGSSPVCGWGPGQGVPGVSDAYGGAGAAAWACSHAPGSMPHVPEERGLGTCREGVCQTWYSSWLLPARSCAGAYEDGRVRRGDVCLSVLPGRCAAPCGSPTGAGSSVLPRAPCSQQPVGSAASTRLLARRWHPHPTLTLGSQASRQPCIYGWAVTPPPPSSTPAPSTAGSEASRTFAVTFVPSLPGQDGWRELCRHLPHPEPGSSGPAQSRLHPPGTAERSRLCPATCPCLLSTGRQEQSHPWVTSSQFIPGESQPLVRGVARGDREPRLFLVLPFPWAPWPDPAGTGSRCCGCFFGHPWETVCWAGRAAAPVVCPEGPGFEGCPPEQPPVSLCAASLSQPGGDGAGTLAGTHAVVGCPPQVQPSSCGVSMGFFPSLELSAGSILIQHPGTWLLRSSWLFKAKNTRFQVSSCLP